LDGRPRADKRTVHAATDSPSDPDGQRNSLDVDGVLRDLVDGLTLRVPTTSAWNAADRRIRLDIPFDGELIIKRICIARRSNGTFRLRMPSGRVSFCLAWMIAPKKIPRIPALAVEEREPRFHA